MSNCPQAMTPASIRYLLVLDDLCREGRGVRSVEIAARMNVSKPSAHSMLQNLCQAGLVEKERYGTVFLTLGRACPEPPGTDGERDTR